MFADQKQSHDGCTLDAIFQLTWFIGDTVVSFHNAIGSHRVIELRIRTENNVWVDCIRNL